jgi:hypothetical protein
MFENKAQTPASTESENMVNNTLIPTLPHKIVVNKKLESFLSVNTVIAALLPSTSSCNLLSEKKLNLIQKKWQIVKYKAQ